MLRDLTFEDIFEIAYLATQASSVDSPKMTLREIYHAQKDGPGRKLENFLSQLNGRALIELKALMWIGRGFDGPFPEAVLWAGREAGPRDASDIADKSPILPYWLARGLTNLFQEHGAMAQSV